MELREIVSFFHVARLKSVSKAAKRLELGQPTVTTHLKKLEEEFKLILFDRIKRPIQLTSEGGAFLELVTPVVEAIDNLKSSMNYTEGRGSFIVGGYPDILEHHLPESVQEFSGLYPHVRIQLVPGPYFDLMAALKSGAIDMALCSAPASDDRSLEFLPLFEYDLLLLTPPDHPLTQTQNPSLQEVSKFPLILTSPHSFNRVVLDQAFRDQGLTYESVLEIDGTDLLKRYVEIGIGVSLCPGYTLHPEDYSHLGVVAMPHVVPTGSIGLCTLRGKFLGAAVTNFMNIVKKKLENHKIPASKLAVRES
jgi:DNA-binding transcriptional LysR family regulator